jgi:hypothetical protein
MEETAMKLPPDSPLHRSAEEDLLELIRLEDSKSFRLVIMHNYDTGEWRVELTEFGADGGTAFGSGEDFTTAWLSQTGRDLNPPPPIGEV